MTGITDLISYKVKYIMLLIITIIINFITLKTIPNYDNVFDFFVNYPFKSSVFNLSLVVLSAFLILTLAYQTIAIALRYVENIFQIILMFVAALVILIIAIWLYKDTLFFYPIVFVIVGAIVRAYYEKFLE